MLLAYDTLSPIGNKEFDLAVTCDGLELESHYSRRQYVQFDVKLRLTGKSDCNRQCRVEM
jgi:hypothetical protein